MDLDPVLKRFQQRFYRKNQSGEIVPAAGVVVKFHSAGATVQTELLVRYLVPPTIVNVSVYQVGTVIEGEQVQNGATEEDVLNVHAVDAANRVISVINDSGHDITLAASARLIRRDGPVNLYSDPLGTALIGTSKATDADGWVECYVRDYRYDFTVPDVTVLAAYADAVGSWVMR
jgi:hypothetical protein